MEGVDHVHVVQVGGSGLVGEVDRVLEGQVPDGEGLELGITGLDAPLVLVVELGQAGGHLAAAGAGGRDDDEGTLGLDVVVLAVALVADDAGHVVGVAGDLIVAEGAYAHAVQLVLKGFDLGGGGVHGHADAAHEQAHALEGVDEAENVEVVGDAVVAAHLAADDVLRADDDDDLGLLLELQQHLQLGVRLKARQHAGGVVVVEQLAAKLEVELVVELCDALPDVLGLHLKIFRVVKAFFHGMLLFLILQLPLRHVGGAAGRRVTQTLYSIAYDRLRRNYFLKASSCSRCSNSSSSSMSSFRNIRQKLMKSSRQESQMARLPMGASARLPRPAPSANRKMMAK